MRRRDFLVGSVGAAGALALGAGPALADGAPVDVIIGSDQAVVDFWTNVVLPAAGTALPGSTVGVTAAGSNAGMMALADRAMAALKTHTDPQFDFLEAFNPRNVVGGIEAGLWTDVSKAGLSNFGKLSPAAIDTPFGLPYRGSQVLLAYDSNKMAAAPKTWAELVAWIKAHPGQFIYNRPDKGGSGGNFVRRAIHEANGRDPSVFTTANYSQVKAGQTLPAAWKILSDIAPSLYGKGSYSAGNSSSLQLLVSGAVSMVPAWSDQALAGLRSGDLPPHIKLAQLQDLAFCGGFAYCAIPTNAAHKAEALKLADLLISPAIQEQILSALGGFPAVDWRYVSEEARKANADVIPKSVPSFPEGQWESAVNDGWYRSVAPSVARQ